MRVVHFEIGGARIRVLRRRDAADEHLALRPHPDAARIDHQRHARKRRATRDDEHAALARLDRKREPASAATSPACGPAALTSVPQAMRSPFASVTPVTRCPRSQCRDFAVDVSRALGARRLAQQREQRVRIEPAFAGAAECAEREVGWIQPWKLRHDRVRIEQHDVGAFGRLHAMVRAQHRRAAVARHEEIAALAKGDIGLRAERAFRSRKNDIPKPHIRMFSGVENCWRIEAAESAVAA